MIAALLTLAAPSFAEDGGSDGGISVLLGTGTAFDGDPASLRLSLRGEAGPSDGDVVAISFLLPVTIATRGESGFGVSVQDTLLELPPSLRVRFLPDSPVSLYGDVGAGLAISTRTTDTWFGDSNSSSTAFMTRAGLGLEIGDPDAFAFIVEPASLSTYHTNEQIRASYGLMLGLSARL